MHSDISKCKKEMSICNCHFFSYFNTFTCETQKWRDDDGESTESQQRNVLFVFNVNSTILKKFKFEVKVRWLYLAWKHFYIVHNICKRGLDARQSLIATNWKLFSSSLLCLLQKCLGVNNLILWIVGKITSVLCFFWIAENPIYSQECQRSNIYSKDRMSLTDEQYRFRKEIQ